MLLVDDYIAKTLELDRILDQSMRTDDQANFPGLKLCADLLLLTLRCTPDE